MTKKQKLKKKLLAMDPKERKAYIAKLRERKAERLASKQASDDLSEEHGRDDETLESAFDLEEDSPLTKAEQGKLRRGIALHDLWKGLRVMAEALKSIEKKLTLMYEAGVTRRPESVPPATPGGDITRIDPKRLQQFVQIIPVVKDGKVSSLWDFWGCGKEEGTTCAECPYHRGLGVSTQNRVCAGEARKAAQKQNRRVSLAAGIPYNVKSIDTLARKDLVALLGAMGISAFSAMDGSREGLAKYVLSVQRKFKGLPKGATEAVKIPRLVQE